MLNQWASGPVRDLASKHKVERDREDTGVGTCTCTGTHTCTLTHAYTQTDCAHTCTHRTQKKIENPFRLSLIIYYTYP